MVHGISKRLLTPRRGSQKLNERFISPFLYRNDTTLGQGHCHAEDQTAKRHSGFEYLASESKEKLSRPQERPRAVTLSPSQASTNRREKSNDPPRHESIRFEISSMPFHGSLKLTNGP